jgi:hypothetical protein
MIAKWKASGPGELGARISDGLMAEMVGEEFPGITITR